MKNPIRWTLCLLGAAILVPAGLQAGNVQKGPGLNTVMLATLQGTVRVDLPSDAAPGDTISGTVTLLPDGEKDKRKRKNERALAELGITVANRMVPVGEGGRFTVQIPPVDETRPGESRRLKVILASSGGGRDGDRGKDGASGKTLDEISLPLRDPVVVPVPPEDSEDSPRFLLPKLGQIGQPLYIPGTFDGNLLNTGLKFGGKDATPLAESPRGAVFVNPDIPGLSTIELREADHVVEGRFRNVQIGLSAVKTNLLKGESTTVTTRVTGLEDLDRPVPLLLRNETPGVVTLGGGNLQVWAIGPGATSGDAFERTRTVTGVTPGGFALTARVTLPPELPPEIPENPLVPLVYSSLFPEFDIGELEPDLSHAGSLLWRAFEAPEGEREMPTERAATAFARLAAYLLGSRFGLSPEEIDRAMTTPPDELLEQAKEACEWAIETVEPPVGAAGGTVQLPGDLSSMALPPHEAELIASVAMPSPGGSFPEPIGGTREIELLKFDRIDIEEKDVLKSYKDRWLFCSKEHHTATVRVQFKVESGLEARYDVSLHEYDFDGTKTRLAEKTIKVRRTSWDPGFGTASFEIWCGPECTDAPCKIHGEDGDDHEPNDHKYELIACVKPSGGQERDTLCMDGETDHVNLECRPCP